MHTAFEKYKTEARGYAGPAVVETFGEKDFAPVNKPEAVKMTDEQSTLMVEHRTQMGQLQRQYIIEEERSFTIIAFPIPEVGDCFEELFRETIRINTLDYKKYQRIQQTIIDALDQADHCEVKGCNGNHTDITVNLWKLKDPAKETIFENCVADVNIPVGEVFTSPVLEGTNGVLHVTKVFLNGLEYKNLEITFENGRIKNYNCANFATEEENKAFIKENILFRHKTLPLGEFAIGTNTTAYVAAKRLGVEARMPILIAEKMGPHFAVGDTCYSHAEEVKVYNPDGKEIVARDNEVAALRSVNPSKAYFNCHTDITIPYDELAELTAVKKDGGRIPIIANGRFRLTQPPLPLWPDTDSAYHAICEGLRYADLVKLSEEELEFLTKAADHTAGMRELLERYDIRMLVVTLGADGCLCLCRNGVFLRQHTIQVTALDTTGSGDAFWGTFLSELLLCDCCDRIPAPQVLQHILGVSCVAGSLTATAFGAVPAMPTTSALHAGMLRLLER